MHEFVEVRVPGAELREHHLAVEVWILVQSERDDCLSDDCPV